MSKWRIELLAKSHKDARKAFDCGEESLNTFLHSYASQNAKKGLSKTYVALPCDSDDIVGYYTLSSGSVAFENLPDASRNPLPRYPVPTAHLGRLAVDRSRQGQGWGGILLVDALLRVRDVAKELGIHAVTVHALNDAAKSFYESYGLMPLLDDPHHLFLPVATIKNL